MCAASDEINRSPTGALAEKSPSERGAVDRVVVEQLYRRYGFQLERRCRRVLGDPEQAADAAQEVFVRLMRKGASFRGDSEWMTWLYRVATNVCLNKLRSRKRAEQAMQRHAADAASPSSPESLVHAQRALAAIAGRFDERTQRIAVYYFIDGLDQSEIAKLVGFSRVSVNRRLARLRKYAQESSSWVGP